MKTIRSVLIILYTPVHAAFVLVWLLVTYAIPGVLVCKADAGQIGWRVERARRRTLEIWDLLPWHFYSPLMRDLHIASYFSAGYSEALPCCPGSSRIYIHSAPFPSYAFTGVHNIKQVVVVLPGTADPMNPFHYTVFLDRQDSQDGYGFKVPDDILRNHNVGNAHERLYGNIVAVKNECMPLPDGTRKPYEEAVRVINASMEDAGIIKDVLEALVEDHSIGTLALPADTIWVEVKLLGGAQVFPFQVPPPSPRLQPSHSHLPNPSYETQDNAQTRRRGASYLGGPEESSGGGFGGGGRGGKGRTVHRFRPRGRSVRIQTPTAVDLAEFQFGGPLGGPQSAQLPPEARLDESPIDLNTYDDDNRRSGATNSPWANLMSPAPSVEISDGPTEYLSD